MKNSWALGVLAIFAAILMTRLYKIQSVPSVISHDEIYYTVQAKTLALTGKDPAGTWVPWQLTAADPLYAELPGVVMTPAHWLLPHNAVLASKLTFAVLGSALALMLGAVAYVITRSRASFVITTVLAAVNPWLFQFSRMGFDALLSLFFYFLGFLVLLNKKSQFRWLASIPFVLGFFQYQGLKIIFVPFVFLSILYVWLNEQLTFADMKKKTKRSTLLSLGFVAIAAVLLMGWYTVRTLTRPDTGRSQSDLITSDKGKITSWVDVERQQAIETDVAHLFSNKFTVVLNQFAQQYVASFNPVPLFITGEPLRNPFSVWKWGMFYALDALLVLLGIYAVTTHPKLRPAAWFLLGLLVIAPLPSAINGKGLWVMFRASLLVPAFIVLAGLGLTSLMSRRRAIVAWLCIGLYALSVARFGYEYFYKYPVYGTQGKYFAERVISSYTSRNASQPVLILADEPKFMFESLLTYTNAITPSAMPAIQHSFQTDHYAVAQVSVENRCVDLNEVATGKIIIADSSIPLCNDHADAQALLSRATITHIPSLLDSGSLYTVYNDQLCGGFALDRYSHVDTDVFAVEQLSTQQFCESFFTRE